MSIDYPNQKRTEISFPRSIPGRWLRHRSGLPIVPVLLSSAGSLAGWVIPEELLRSADQLTHGSALDPAVVDFALRHACLGTAFIWLLLAERSLERVRGNPPGKGKRFGRWFAKDTVLVAASYFLTIATGALGCLSSRREDEVLGVFLFLSVPAFGLLAVVVRLTLLGVAAWLPAALLVSTCIGTLALGPVVGLILVSSAAGGSVSSPSEFEVVFLLGQSVPMGLAILLCLAVWWLKTDHPGEAVP
jgi:hypothetical protein